HTSGMAVASLVGTPFHRRTGALNRNHRWREWAGYLAADRYADHHDIEYNAIREAAAMIDVSPLFKYLVSGPDAVRLVDRVIVRDATRLKIGQVYYTCWCDEAGKVLDDGTVCRLGDTSFRWTAAEPNLRWIRMNARGLDADVHEVTEDVAALAVQGPRSRDLLAALTGESWDDLGYFRERQTTVRGIDLDVTRTGYTGDLGYELWVDAARAPHLWDAVMEEGRAYGARAVGMLALDVARIEAGLILIDVDYSSARHAVIAEQTYSPFELGILGRFVSFKKASPYVGRAALEAERDRGGPARRLVGVELDWDDIERVVTSVGLFPEMPAEASRTHVPLYDGRRQAGRITSMTWSPTLKRSIALASVAASYEAPGTTLQAEWTVEARRRRVSARVVPLPFFDPPRKRA
ncbi:MAG TPA: aminomethyltransferase family protein, partial [Actinomycetota bacterium]|nr:aminomethyltransferase family protein [Actinomycetota bacterium]